MTIKQVRFNNDVKVRYMCHWSYAYRNARRGTWIQEACDRARFQMKILRYAEIINPVLEHKLKVFHSS